MLGDMLGVTVTARATPNQMIEIARKFWQHSPIGGAAVCSCHQLDSDRSLACSEMAGAPCHCDRNDISKCGA